MDATVIQADAPHPLSYRPDLPLRSELHEIRREQCAYERGYDEAQGATRREMREARAKIDALTSQLTAIGTPEK